MALAEFRWVNSPYTNFHSSPPSCGTQLAVSGTDSLVARVFSIRPRVTACEANPAGEKEIKAANAGETVWHVYDLVRGATKADVGELVGRRTGDGLDSGVRMAQFVSLHLPSLEVVTNK